MVSCFAPETLMSQHAGVLLHFGGRPVSDEEALTALEEQQKAGHFPLKRCASGGAVCPWP